MIIYGDSYTSGENNGNISFADYLDLKKCGVSGSCLGEYSIYPVQGGSFLSSYKKSGKAVLLEYGINDAASLAVGYVSMDTIKVSIAKTVDLLKDNDVYFLALTKNEDDLKAFCERYVDYLNLDYLGGLYTVSDTAFQDGYKSFVALTQKKFKTLYMLPDGFQDFDKDGIHPTNKGYKIIAEYLKSQLGRELSSKWQTSKI